MDANHDGKLTEDELPERGRQRFSGADSDQDGAITLEELKKFEEKRRLENAKRMIERLDEDGDGKLALSEIPERMRPRLQPLDRNRDGILTQEELAAPRPDNAARRDPKRLIARLDKDGDGALSGDEIPGWMQRRMERLDKNGDGRLTVDELGVGRDAPPAPPAPAPKKKGGVDL